MAVRAKSDQARADALRATTFRHGGERFVAFSVPLAAPDGAGRLTAAERAVVDGVVRGLSNAEIAAARRTSARTVANQVASILRKLGVHSRYELLAACAGAGRRPDK